MSLTLAERVAALEKWTEMHPETHRLEAQALRLANDFTTAKMHDLNNLRAACVDKAWFEKVHGLLDDRVRELETVRAKSIGEFSLLKYIWQIIVFILGWMAHYLWK
jgi:hypothetical protein